MYKKGFFIHTFQEENTDNIYRGKMEVFRTGHN
jgi:hypothetical protein